VKVIRDKVDFRVRFICQTDKAVKVDLNGKEYWIPDSQIDEDSEVYVGCSLDEYEKCTLVCSEWIATTKEMV
jgi:hypothetical protein